MKTEQKQQARNLFFQTELTKTQIAQHLNISRRTLSYWVKEGNWNRLKNAHNHMPAILAENCYHIFGHLTEYFLSERRLTNPVSYKDVDTLHKLTLTIKNLKSRATINESMQVLTYMLDNIKQHDEPLAQKITPYVDEYIAKRADIYTSDLMPENFTGIGGRIPWEPEDNTEAVIDGREDFFNDPETVETYKKFNIPFPDEDEISSIPSGATQPTPQKTKEENDAESLSPSQEQTPNNDTANNDTPLPDNNNLSITPKQPYPEQPMSEMSKAAKCEQEKSNNTLTEFYKILNIIELSKTNRKTEKPNQSAQNPNEKETQAVAHQKNPPIPHYHNSPLRPPRIG